MASGTAGFNEGMVVTGMKVLGEMDVLVMELGCWTRSRSFLGRLAVDVWSVASSYLGFGFSKSQNQPLRKSLECDKGCDWWYLLREEGSDCLRGVERIGIGMLKSLGIG